MSDFLNRVENSVSSSGKGRQKQRANASKIQACAKIREYFPTLVSKDYYTISEVGQYVGRSAFTVRRWINEGKIDGTRLRGTGPRGRLLVRQDQLLKLFEG